MPITHNCLVYLKIIGNYEQNFYVITKKMLKMKTKTTSTLESLDFETI